MDVKRVSPRHCYNSFRYLLLDSELERLAKYERLWESKFGCPARSDPNAVFHLGDDPDRRCCWSGNGKFPSFRKGMGLLWHCQSETIITAKERLAIMGWPLFPHLAFNANLQFFEFPDEKRGSKYAGNAYHVGTFGMWLLTCLACVKFN